MSKKIQLHIAEPCHENWDAMTPVEQGKFCGSCQKEVVDFSGMSDSQIAAFFKKPTTGSVCGRFMNDQLERDIEIPKKRLPWVRYFFTIALPALFFSKASAQKMGKPAITTLKDTATNPVMVEPVQILGMIAPDRIVPVDTVKVPMPANQQNGLKIWVVDAATGSPLDGVTILMKTSIGNTALLADKEGMAALDIYRKLTFKGIELTLEGYNMMDIPYGAFKKGADGRIVFRMEKSKVLPGQLMIMVDVDSIPVCRVTKGDVAITVDNVKPNELNGVVVDEQSNPVPFASIMGGNKGEGVMADENGAFIIRKEWLKKGGVLQVSSVGFESNILIGGEEQYRNGTIFIRLKAKNIMEEVVVKGFETSVTKGKVIGTVKKDKRIPTVKEEKRTTTETVFPMEKSMFQAYPNPAGSGSTLHLGVQQVAEGYYHLQLSSLNGQLVKQQEIWLDAEARLFNFELPKIASGSYIITLINRETGKKYTEKLLIQ
ncbi:MAG: carboxypeptidase-like regulatory domain-containing protein [Bacteroidetes bacterium]|nr:carboxypeptidase-like regulatory domain-containing protein [Bacteroidota bacterium]